MKLSTLLGFALASSTVQEAFADPDFLTYLEIKDLVADTILNSQGNFTIPANSPPNPLAAKLIRMAFHDSVGTGGVDGLVDMTDLQENAGLEPVILALDYMWGIFGGASNPAGLSKADFSAWSYIAAAEFGGRNEDTPFDIPLRYGRVDPTDDPVDIHEEFPHGGGHATGGDILSYFSTEFGFNATEATALMGAHALGGASIANSGFVGIWTLQASTLDERYFSRILGNALQYATCSQIQTVDNETECIGTLTEVDTRVECEVDQFGCWNTADGLAIYCGVGTADPGWRCGGWEQVPSRFNSPNGKYQWKHSCSEFRGDCRGLMLNVDIGLLIELDPYLCDQAEIDSGVCVEGQVSPDRLPGDCAGTGRAFASCFSVQTPESSTALVDLEDDVSAWITLFVDVFDRMMLHGEDPASLNLVERLATAARGDPCPEACYDETTDWSGAVDCPLCANGVCSQRRAGKLCRPPN